MADLTVRDALARLAEAERQAAAAQSDRAEALAALVSAAAALDGAEQALRRLVSALGFAAGCLRRADAGHGALYLNTGEAELRRSRQLAIEAMAAVDRATDPEDQK